MLFERAKAGELKLHVPAVCLTEGRATIRRRYQPRKEADAIRQYMAWAKQTGRIKDDQAKIVHDMLEGFETKVRKEIAMLDRTLCELASHSEAVDVFALDDEMLERCVEIATSELDLQPSDQAALAGVLVAASRLRDDSEAVVAFCELDSDLQPWDKQGNFKQPLTQFYDDAGVWVYGDFELAEPPPDWWLEKVRPAAT